MFARRIRRPFLKSGVFSEEVEQRLVIKHLREKYPGALYTIAPNGMKLPMSVAIKLKDMGYRAGTPDILIFEPRGIYKGLFIEMKARKGGRVSDEQTAFILALRDRGYSAIVCEGASVAVSVIDAYMGVANDKNTL